MQTLQIDKSKARKLYKNAAPEFKELLHETFGEKFFNEKITDRVKTFEDAYEIVGIRPQDITCTNDTKDELAYKKLKIIAQALNEGWTPDWSNSNERKWFPWFEYKSGFGFSRAHYDYWRTVRMSALAFALNPKSLQNMLPINSSRFTMIF
jgi:hypothetical protein